LFYFLKGPRLHESATESHTGSAAKICSAAAEKEEEKIQLKTRHKKL